MLDCHDRQLSHQKLLATPLYTLPLNHSVLVHLLNLIGVQSQLYGSFGGFVLKMLLLTKILRLLVHTMTRAAGFILKS